MPRQIFEMLKHQIPPNKSFLDIIMMPKVAQLGQTDFIVYGCIVPQPMILRTKT